MPRKIEITEPEVTARNRSRVQLPFESPVESIARTILEAGLSENDCHLLFDTIKEVHSQIKAKKIALAKVKLHLGAECKVSGIRPKDLNGVVGKITSFNDGRTRANIRITKEAFPFSKWSVGKVVGGIPVQCLEKV